MTERIVLASASQGRSDLLRRTGLPFIIDPSHCCETTETSNPQHHVTTLALRKAKEVARRHPDAIVVGADTIVELDGQIFGKPESTAEAVAMLITLRGRTHRLITGIAIIHALSERSYQGIETTHVHLRALTDDQVTAYVASGESVGKSGSYEIQGLGATIVDRIEGDFANVVGLPLAHLAFALEGFGLRVP